MAIVRFAALAALLLAPLSSPAMARDQARNKRPSTPKELLTEERKAPTTAKNVLERYKTLKDLAGTSAQPDLFLNYDTGMRIEGLLGQGQYQEAAELVRSAILNLAGADAGAPGPSIERLIAEEKSAPTTAKNVRQRFKALEAAIKSAGQGQAERYLEYRSYARIEGLLAQNDLQQAAGLVRSAILNLEKVPKDAGRETRGGSPSGPGEPGAGGERIAPGSTRELEQLVEQEKESPTTERNFEIRYGALIHAILETRDPPRYVSTGAGELIQELLSQGKRAEAATKLRALVLGTEKQLPSKSAGPAQPATPTPEPSSDRAATGAAASPAAQPSAPGEADRIGASTLYFKAMQDYARGKLSSAVSLLESGAKLDPANQDIANSLKRLRKER